MNTNQSKLQQKQKEEAVEPQQASVRPEAREFATTEEALRCDAAQIEVPPEVESRLAESIQQEQASEPPAATSWWKRIFL